MAPEAILLKYGRTMFRELDVFWNPAGIKSDRVSHAFDTLPYHVPWKIVVGQMAVDAFHPPMSALMKPCFIFRFHDMATGTKLRCS